jgi:hypothetical protein
LEAGIAKPGRHVSLCINQGGAAPLEKHIIMNNFLKFCEKKWVIISDYNTQKLEEVINYLLLYSKASTKEKLF